MTYSQNRVLAKVSPPDLGVLGPHLKLVELKQGQVLAESRAEVRKVYFPHGGILSSIVETSDGLGVETGMIGRDGVFGAAHALDHRLAINRTIVQVPCWASVAETGRVRDVANRSSDFRTLVFTCEQFFAAQVQQTAACNALHTIEQRTCKWLMRMHDLVGERIPLTQEFLAQMIGVRRTSVTTVAAKLQSEGLISYRRGKVNIEDVARVEQYACECGKLVREFYAEFFGESMRSGIVVH